jgi:NitT/TauT family transport system substrate-binding protein
MRSVRVMKPFDSPFYAPLHIARELGHFRAEDLDVTISAAPEAGGTVDALLAGRIEIALGGLMRSFELADGGGPLLPHFAEVNSRNGFFLLARAPRPDFSWKDLAGKTVISFAEAPTPWQCMLSVLRRHGVDPSSVTMERSLPVAQAVAAFTSGRGDFLETGQPTTEALLEEGMAHLVVSMGDATGAVPFSSLMTTPAFLEQEREVVKRFTRAIYRTQRWIAARGATDVAEPLRAAFPDIPSARLRRVVDRYHRQGTWAAVPRLGRSGFDALQQILLDGEFIRHRHEYERLVDVDIATQVMREA